MYFIIRKGIKYDCSSNIYVKTKHAGKIFGVFDMFFFGYYIYISKAYFHASKFSETVTVKRSDYTSMTILQNGAKMVQYFCFKS